MYANDTSILTANNCDEDLNRNFNKFYTTSSNGFRWIS